MGNVSMLSIKQPVIRRRKTESLIPHARTYMNDIVQALPSVELARTRKEPSNFASCRTFSASSLLSAPHHHRYPSIRSTCSAGEGRVCV